MEGFYSPERKDIYSAEWIDAKITALIKRGLSKTPAQSAVRLKCRLFPDSKLRPTLLGLGKSPSFTKLIWIILVRLTLVVYSSDCLWGFHRVF